MKEISLEKQITCVEREIRMRLLMYPRWVVQKKMPQEQCDYEIAAMKAVLETMQRSAGQEPEVADVVGGQRSLF